MSIHLNSANSDTVQGTSTYYRYIGFRPLSVAILNRMLTLGLKEFGNVGNFNFSLSGPTDYPNALVEVAFLSNPEDEKKILKPAFRKAVAQKIYLGIMDWLNQIKTGGVPTMKGYLMQEQEWVPGEDLFLESFSPENEFGVVFEDDGEALYFYAVERMRRARVSRDTGCAAYHEQRQEERGRA